MSQQTLHPVVETNTYVTVVLPIAVPKPYTYSVPTELIDAIQFGIRVEVQFGKSRLYSALVVEINSAKPDYDVKPVLNIIDNEPIIHYTQWKLWQWMASYYACTVGEVMNAALPSGLKLNSETKVVLNEKFDQNFEHLNDKEYLIAEALSIQNELTIFDLQGILQQKTVYPIIKSLMEKEVLYVVEELVEKYKPKREAFLELREPYKSDNKLLTDAFDLVSRSEKQTQALLAYIQISKNNKDVARKAVCDKANVNTSVIKAMEKKNIFSVVSKEVSRLSGYEDEILETPDLTDQQIKAIEEIRTTFETKNVALLHGVTGSGKTRVYIEMMKDNLRKGEQVLYLLPEIALTGQLIGRLQLVFGDDIVVYHSRMTNNERIELWKEVMKGKPVLMGARSGLFLPFKKLKLIVVDEEHDFSFKQIDPAPRYHARDSAIYLAHIHGAKVILGSATPAVESYYNSTNGKYGLIEMKKRFGNISMPKIELVDAKKEYKQRKMQSHFTSVLIAELKLAFANGEQAILFQNRRGFAPSSRCMECDWTAGCTHCDVSLTYHKFTGSMRCHYCGYQTKVPIKCPACGSPEINMQGFGTEKIEEEIKIYFPEIKVARLDMDTARKKQALENLIQDFEDRKIDLLIGTQMVTKGFDFDNVGIVGVLSADQILQFPDFRSVERAFQLITQVSGRAGRKKKQGKVIVQAFNIAHPVLQDIIQNNFTDYYNREIAERETFGYPPFTRLIKITIKHRDPKVVNYAGKSLDVMLREKLGDRVDGPAIPGIPRIRNQYLTNFQIKITRNNKQLPKIKDFIWSCIHRMNKEKGMSGVRVNLDVDPV